MKHLEICILIDLKQKQHKIILRTVKKRRYTDPQLEKKFYNECVVFFRPAADGNKGLVIAPSDAD